MRIVAVQLDHINGHLRAYGGLMEAVTPSKRSIGMVFQSYALYPHLNVENNIAMACSAAAGQAVAF